MGNISSRGKVTMVMPVKQKMRQYFLMVEGRSEQDDFFDTLGTEKCVLIIFFLMFSLIDRLRISVCKSYVSHNVFSPYGPL